MMAFEDLFLRPKVAVPETISFSASEGVGGGGGVGGVGRVVLKAPKTLNAITGEMAVALANQLDVWRGEPAIAAVSIKAESPKAFSVGGDIRNLYQAITDERFPELHAFFAHEYRMNADVYRYNKPYIAWVHGLVMGGGTGVSLHGSHVVVGDTTAFAMPEVMIGFVPDVGASYFYQQFPIAVARMLGMTATRIGAYDMCHYGIATHYIPEARWAEAEEGIATALATRRPDTSPFDTVTAVLDSFAETAPKPPNALADLESTIDTLFAGKSAAEIVQHIAGSAIATDAEHPLHPTIAGWQHAIAKASPTALALFCALLNRTRGLAIEQCIQHEYSLACWLMHQSDIVEGIREAVITKTKQPRWAPAGILEVDKTTIDTAFAFKEHVALFPRFS
ncbi:MAG: enoyl-CoA hydratase/isomerase family protein [Alphaproteobacteria bacterium]|nr:enoyl-CoA hydratase/isomerase family protein [Alphaproteobacteria bacterium]